MAIFAALLTSSAMFTSCGDDDTNNTLPNNDPVIPVTPDEGEAMSPADQKERLETVALDFMAQTPSSDFDASGNLADYIKDTYVDDYDWDNVGDWAEDIFDAARQALGTTTTETETEHYGDSSYEYNSSYTNYKAVLMASNFTGHFTARNGRWELSEADDLRFIFPDQNGQECVVRLETSGDVKQVYAFNVDDWMDYDYENSGDTYISNDYYDRTQCTIGVPEHIVVTLTQNNSQVVRTAIDIGPGKHTGRAVRHQQEQPHPRRAGRGQQRLQVQPLPSGLHSQQQGSSVLRDEQEQLPAHHRSHNSRRTRHTLLQRGRLLIGKL